ncbi:hypothetical protein KIH31_11025 [Paenarthrobacter sp. DKR-5]|uniref:CU044_2847 family protein n=1 Tax=Paenarthrobacter sp. DKR-5 TaxID=2835535 RepID=UPI001BDDA141|nr:CU044_2847 family protein [Paenarthrobacter sp. DKR-5]MBT1003139.1 hypothetical protein [Paenarthrobacter sp. DKR-5]
MTEVMRYEVGSGVVLVEVEDNSYGVEHPLRNEHGIVDAGRRFEDALSVVRSIARATVESLSELPAGKVEVQFGVKLAGEAGALVAKSSHEGHFAVKLSWSPEAMIGAGQPEPE